MPATQDCVPLLKVIYEKVEADSRFSLHYLRAVDAVINVATDVRNNAATVALAIDQFLARLAEPAGFDEPIDPTHKFAALSASGEATVKKVISAIHEMDDAWEGSSILAEHAEEVSVSNEEAIGTLEKLHDAMVDLRWAVIEHDADLEEPEGEAIDNVEDLTADLRSS